ncbi:hypothetical protein LXL04_028127 [Taraxacum kok-saghyz]
MSCLASLHFLAWIFSSPRAISNSIFGFLPSLGVKESTLFHLMAANFHNTNFKFFHFSHFYLLWLYGCNQKINRKNNCLIHKVFYFSILPKTDVESIIEEPIICKYCDRSFKDVYPPLKFKVSMKDVFGKTAIVAESSRKPISGKNLPPDYWDFVPSACVIDCIQKNDQFSWHNK